MLLDHAKKLTLFLASKNPEQYQKYFDENGDIQEYMLNTIGTYATSEQMSALSNRLLDKSANLADLSSLAKPKLPSQREDSPNSTFANSQPDFAKNRVSKKPGHNQMDDSSFKTD